MSSCVPARALDRVMALDDEILVETSTPTPRGQGATSWVQIDLRARGEPEQPPDDEVEKMWCMVQSLTRAHLVSPSEDFVIKDLVEEERKDHRKRQHGVLSYFRNMLVEPV